MCVVVVVVASENSPEIFRSNAAEWKLFGWIKIRNGYERHDSRVGTDSTRS